MLGKFRIWPATVMLADACLEGALLVAMAGMTKAHSIPENVLFNTHAKRSDDQIDRQLHESNHHGTLQESTDILIDRLSQRRKSPLLRASMESTLLGKYAESSVGSLSSLEEGRGSDTNKLHGASPESTASAETMGMAEDVSKAFGRLWKNAAGLLLWIGRLPSLTGASGSDSNGQSGASVATTVSAESTAMSQDDWEESPFEYPPQSPHYETLHFGRLLIISDRADMCWQMTGIIFASLGNGAIAACWKQLFSIWNIGILDSVPWTLLSVLQSFLVAFRVSQSYQNFLRGREALQMASKSTRMVAVLTRALFPTDVEHCKQMARGAKHTACFEETCEEWLAACERNAAIRRDIGRLLAVQHSIECAQIMGDASLPAEVTELLTVPELGELQRAKSYHRAGVRPILVAAWIIERVGAPGTPVASELAALFTHWSVCRRISTTPLPSPYRMITDLCLILWLLTLPLLLASHSDVTISKTRLSNYGSPFAHGLSYAIPTVMSSIITAVYALLRFLSEHLYNPFSGTVRLPIGMHNRMVLDDLGILIPGCLDIGGRENATLNAKTKYRNLTSGDKITTTTPKPRKEIWSRQVSMDLRRSRPVSIDIRPKQSFNESRAT